MYKNTFLQIDGESGVQFFGLPEEVTKIEQNKEKLHKAKGGDKFDSTKCLKCGMRDDVCGILLTRIKQKIMSKR